MSQFNISKHSCCQRRGVSLIDKSDRSIRLVSQPTRESTHLLRLGALATIAMDRQSNDPTQDLVFVRDSDEVFLI
jgi:hypothetical protein